ncbi:MAG TPA: multicopper oxidase family protein, partial [Aestuariivirgaceae bacterium]|nr:multicopper oxidase family protein [Aestuariivirgaceae bacterium]
WAETGDDGFTVLRAMGGISPLLGEQGDPTAIWGFEGQSPGPTLKVRQGEQLKVRLVNELLEPTSIHWHGIRLPNAMDGTVLTQAPVEPGESFDYVFAPPDAGTFWYHPHFRSAQQVDRGLYGALIVEEENLPAGMSDVVMVIDDWWLFDSGAINEDAFGDLMIAAHGGRMGNWLTVNGISRPYLTAPAGARLRLRLINAANARIMRLAFKGADPRLLAIDGQPLASPRTLAAGLLALPPGGRADIGLARGLKQVVVAIEIEGEFVELALIDREAAAEAEGEGEGEGEGAAEAEGEGEVEVEVEEVEADAGDFAPLPANPLPDMLDLSGALAVSVVMQGGAMGGMPGGVFGGKHMRMRELHDHGMAWTMNGISDLAEDPLVTVERGQTVALTVDNKTAWAHVMHLHGHHVRIVEAGGREVDDPAWRDSVLIEPHAIVTMAFLADNPGKWLFHCHVLEHGETGMMTWLEVT